MCDKLPYCNPRIDKCLMSIIKSLNRYPSYKTLASCCGHAVYRATIVVREKNVGIFEYYSGMILSPKKRNRYYKRDKKGFYFIPEVIG